MSVELIITASGPPASGKTYYLDKILELLMDDERYSTNCFELKDGVETLWIHLSNQTAKKVDENG